MEVPPLALEAEPDLGVFVTVVPLEATKAGVWSVLLVVRVRLFTAPELLVVLRARFTVRGKFYKIPQAVVRRRQAEAGAEEGPAHDELVK